MQRSDPFLGNDVTGTGNALNNYLEGSTGDDTLQGLDGNDRLYGATAADILNGGEGNDTFIFDSALDRNLNVDTILDFSVTDDTISLSTNIFTTLVEEGSLSSINFHSSETGVASDDNDYILYNTTTGSLLYDADGSGQGVAIEFATLSSRPQIDEKNFVIASL